MKFLKWLTDNDQQAFFANATNNLPANRSAVSGLVPVLAQFSDDLDNTFHLNTMPAHERPQVVEAWDKGIQSIMTREKTPAQIAQDVQNVKERELRKKS
jgi:ABC-type glycerol-3-phosphate transport system substrate-binding protein